MAAATSRPRGDYDHLIKLLLIGDSGTYLLLCTQASPSLLLPHPKFVAPASGFVDAFEGLARLASSIKLVYRELRAMYAHVLCTISCPG